MTWKNLINKEETVMLATYVFHHEQGPKLFHLLGLKRKIPDFVRDLVEEHRYIPAVRMICFFKLKDFSATILLMKEITELRRSAMEQVESKDVGKLRAIVELVADYKLDIDLPGDLIAKLVFQRENSTPHALRCSVIGPLAQETTSSHNMFSAAATLSSSDLVTPKREFKALCESICHW